MRKFILSVICVTFLSGCSVGRDYKRPELNIPGHFRASAVTPGGGSGLPLGEEKWWQVFRDPQLHTLISTALKQNYDVRMAASRVMQAQARLSDITGRQLPDISAQGELTEERAAAFLDSDPYKTNQKKINLTLDWHMDFWGRGRRAIEASRAEYWATQWAEREVATTLIAQVAGAYFQLRELDLELQISKQSLISRQKSLELTKVLADHGSTSLVDVRQAEQLVYTARETIPALERRIQQQENLLSILLGQNPGSIVRGLPVAKQPYAPVVPVGLPSSLLQRRPDIMQAEQQLRAANAAVGVAQGAFLPDFALTGSGGFESASLSKLLDGPSGFWDLAVQASQPIFNGGRLKAAERLAKARHEEALFNYRKTVQYALRDVSDALIAYSKNQQARRQQLLVARAAADADRISNLRYKAGAASYLEVLDSNTRSYTARIALAQARLSELQALVDLYRALGGGWDLPAAKTQN